MKLLIVGGVAGGASAATRARRLSEDAEIILFERGPDVSFANCGLPYYVGGEIAERSKLLVASPQLLRQRFRIDVRTLSTVDSIDPASKSIQVRNTATGQVYRETYDKLILAPGAAPLRPPLPGIDLPGIHTLRNLADVDRIKAQLEVGVKQAVVIGAGFIGLELVENFVRLGIATTVVELQDQVLPPFDREMTSPILEALTKHGVTVRLGDAAEAFESASPGIMVRLKSGVNLAAQLVVLGVGVRPENQLAAAAGLEVGPRGGIRVDDGMRTSDPDIYAVGDVVEVRDSIFNEPTQIPLAGPANRQGRIAADQIFGRHSRYRGTQGTAIVGCLGRVAAMTGHSEKALKRLQREYRAIYIHPSHHATYYPGAEGMTIKLLFDPHSGEILGAQGVGGAGVDKRIDVLAMAVQMKGTVYQLEQAELCYAPQFGSAKDPVNMLGFVAAGWLRGDHPQRSVEEVLALPAESRPMLVDVRTPSEFERGTIPGAVNIPVDELRERLAELPRDQEIALFCQVGQRGYIATRLLLQYGYQVKNLSGGYRTYLLHRPS